MNPLLMQFNNRKMPLALVIDDDQFIRGVARVVLQSCGFEVEEACDGIEGLSVIERTSPDLVLLDVVMPGLKGFDVCRELRKFAGGKLIPVLMMTSLDDHDSINEAYHAGATDFISKPFNHVVLGHRIRYLYNASRALNSLAISEAKLANAQRLSAVGNWEWDVSVDRLNWSDEMFRIYRISPGHFQAHFGIFLEHVYSEDLPVFEEMLHGAIKRQQSIQLDHRILLADGTLRYVHFQGEYITNPKTNASYLQGTVQDITERKQNEARIRYLVNYDSLTNLPNRHLLQDRVNQAIVQATRTQHRVAMLVIGLDGFKFINDSFGHAVGDQLLQAVGQRLHQTVREGDTVARVGGDGFAIILPGLAQTQMAPGVAQKVLNAFTPSFTIDGHELHVTASIGISIFPEDGNNPDLLLKNADAAMYSAKAKGRNCYQYYAPEMSVHAEQRVLMENALRQAIEHDEFEVYYQPKVNLATGKIHGAEALIRWQSPTLGFLPPDRFIPLTEETGLIVPIGEWVLRTACIQARKWHEMGFPHFTIAVNLSARQFSQQSVLDLVRQVLSDTGLPPAKLELELTESLLVNNTDMMLQTLSDLKTLGVSLSLDDFGTGYSSLSYLKRFPFDVLKIDRSFVSEVGKAREVSLAEIILLMASTLHLKTVAEGVETAEQLAFLKAHQCDEIQGYYFSRPVPAGQFTAMLTENKGL
ncbi:MAG: hypothetical protein RL748_1652 [Pseudomonadota bacterium]|jgi:diguanylate cyclase (GGDEF)-like protein